jgi:hypothetical protein
MRDKLLGWRATQAKLVLSILETVAIVVWLSGIFPFGLAKWTALGMIGVAGASDLVFAKRAV